jgi:hypothetical protein
MKDIEMNTITTPDRYLGTYLLALMILVVMFAIRYLTSTEQSKQTRLILIWFSALILTVGVLFTQNTLDNFRIKDILKNRAELISYDMPALKENLATVNTLSRGSFEKRTKILVTALGWAEIHYVQYLALPNKSTTLDQNDPLAKTCDKLHDNEYLITTNLYTDFAKINTCLGEKINVKPQAIYSISTDEKNKIVLKEINTK